MALYSTYKTIWHNLSTKKTSLLIYDCHMKQFLICLMTIALLHSTVAAAPPVVDGFLDNDSPLIDVSGTVTIVDDIAAIGGTYVETPSTASISLTTYADGVTIFYTQSDGTMSVCINGDCGMALVQSGNQREIVSLGNGMKTITINLADAATFDAVYIHPSAPVSSQTMLEFEHDGNTHVGVLDAYISSGDAIITVLLAVLVMLQIAKFAMEVTQS